ncbi:hypothetical protein B0H13DRAFT_1859681 [Mycena leptocephala]|nr:hypothetical protein B0H13DRAFT_1859681 [Mycena leptocephala]
MPSSEPPSSESDPQVLAAVKAKLAHSKITTASKKRKNSNGDEDEPASTDPDDEETYKSYGRHLARVCGPFDRIHVIVEHGVRIALAASDDEAARRPPTDRKKKKRFERLSASWRIVCDTIPGFREEMIDLGGNVKLRKKVCTEIQTGVDGARGDDTSKMKTNAIDWLMKSQDPSVAIPAADIPDRNKKLGRGTFEKIKAGDKTFPINGMIPAFVYPSDHPYDEDDIEDKLLEGPLPIAARLLFISFFLSTDKTFRQRSRSTRVRRRHFRLQASIAGGLGMRHGMAKTRLGRVMSVMYAHNLSSWAARDGNFSYEDFYWSIVDLFDNGNGQAILDHFNYNVFGTDSTVSREEPEAPAELSAFERLAAQRAAKRARTEGAS